MEGLWSRWRSAETGRPSSVAMRTARSSYGTSPIPPSPTPIGPPLRGHNKAVTSVALSPDGKLLATASDDATVQLWDFSDRAQPAKIGPPLMGHQDAVTSVAFSPDGRTLASVSDDRTLRLWDLGELNTIRDDPLERACAVTGRSLNRGEWDRHAPQTSLPRHLR